MSNGQFLLLGQAKAGMTGEPIERLLTKLTEFVTMSFPRITIPIVVAVFNGVKDGAAVGASKILIPQKVGDETKVTEMTDAIASEKETV